MPPGPFSIENLPAITGTGQLQVVVTDALGRQQVLTQPYYSGSTLLRAGLNEYSFEVGAIREDYGLESFAYGEVLAAGTFRRGITDTFTAELHGETQVDGASALGLDTAWQVGTLGVVTATAAAGADHEDSGWLAGLGVERSGRRLHLFARTQLASERFVQIGLSAFEPRPKQRSFAGVGIDLARLGSLQFAYGRQSYWDSEGVETLGVSYSVSLRPLRLRQPVRESHPVAGLPDRCLPGLDDAHRQSAHRRLELVLPSRLADRRYRGGDGHAAAEPAGRLGHGILPERLEYRRMRRPAFPTRVALARRVSSTRAAATPTAGARRRSVASR